MVSRTELVPLLSVFCKSLCRFCFALFQPHRVTTMQATNTLRLATRYVFDDGAGIMVSFLNFWCMTTFYITVVYLSELAKKSNKYYTLHIKFLTAKYQ